MSAAIQTPTELLEAVAALRLPPVYDQHLQSLMDRNNNGELSSEERQELQALAEWSESISLVRANALVLLGRRP
jgi:hypothetical protein